MCPRGHFIVNTDHFGPEEARYLWDKGSRVITINLDHPVVVAARALNDDEVAFRRLCHEIAFSAYAVARAIAPQASGEMGTFTDKVAVPAGLLAPVPDGVELAQVAAVGLAGITALDAIGALGITGLESMMIQGPVNGVGGFALQLAKARGALVAALTLPAQAELAWKLGADVVIPAGTSPKHSVQRVRGVLGGGVDSAIHVAGDLSITAEIVRPGGKFTSMSGAAAAVTPLRSESELVQTVIAPNGHKLADLLFKVAARRLRSHVDATLSFDQVADAVRSRNDSERIVLVR